MNRIYTLFLCVFIVLFFSKCNKDDEENGNGSSPNPTAQGLSAKVDGEVFTSVTYSATKVQGSNALSIGGARVIGSDTLLIGISIANPSVGTFSMGGVMNFTIIGIYEVKDELYSTTDENASGSIQITMLTDETVMGNFQFTAYKTDLSGNSKSITDGVFNLPVTYVK